MKSLEANAVIRAQDKYIAFLSQYLIGVSAILSSHQCVESAKVEEGNNLRKKISKLKKIYNESN